jgi:hypothetical protein
MKLGKGSIVVWNNKISCYSAEKGASAEVTSDYNGGLSEFLMVKWFDDKSNGQKDGYYDISNFEVVKVVEPISKRIPQNDNRSFKFSPSGKDIALFLSQLLKDDEFNIDDPITDNYLIEVGYELGWTDENSKYVISILKEKLIIK